MAKAKLHLIDAAVVRKTAEPRGRLLDKAFALAFKQLVYAQIWEDPVVDMEALQITPDSRIVTIASGGCNVLSYLTADPARIFAVDLNTAHIALNKLKLAAVQLLPDYEHFCRFFADADSKDNIDAYRRYLSDELDEPTRRYWEGRDLAGRRRINGFTHGIYKRGLLGGFIGFAHLLARLHRIDPREILAADSLDAQRRVFDEKLAPLFDRRLIRWLANQPASLFALGIPPAQYEALLGNARMADVLRARLEKLACDFPIDDNYFAWQAFARAYGHGEGRPLPPYLQRANYDLVRNRADRVEMHHVDFISFLETRDDASLDRYVLLDAQDWMSDAQLTSLWEQITRTARNGARVLFRTAAEPSLLPGRVPDAILSRWLYEDDNSRRFTAADRSSIYGGVHLYCLR